MKYRGQKMIVRVLLVAVHSGIASNALAQQNEQPSQQLESASVSTTTSPLSTAESPETLAEHSCVSPCPKPIEETPCPDGQSPTCNVHTTSWQCCPVEKICGKFCYEVKEINYTLEVNKQFKINSDQLPCNLVWEPPVVENPAIVCATGGGTNQYVITARSPGTTTVLLTQRRTKPPACNIFSYQLNITVSQGGAVPDLSLCASRGSTSPAIGASSTTPDGQAASPIMENETK